MSPFDVQTPGRGSGTGAGEAGDVSNIGNDNNTHGATEIVRRRATSLRLQAFGLVEDARTGPGMTL